MKQCFLEVTDAMQNYFFIGDHHLWIIKVDTRIVSSDLKSCTRECHSKFNPNNQVTWHKPKITLIFFVI